MAQGEFERKHSRQSTFSNQYNLKLNFFHSLSANRDFKLNIPNSQSENALKQLKTLTSPLTKFAANIGASLDPRKYGSKVSVLLG